MRRAALLLLLILPLTVTAEENALREWEEASRHRLAATPEKLGEVLQPALSTLADLQTRTIEGLRPPLLDGQGPHPAAFARLRSSFEADAPLVSQNLGLLVHRGGEALAWAGRPFPPTVRATETPAESTRFELLNAGVFSVLRCRRLLPDYPDLELVLDLPLQASGKHGLPAPPLFDGSQQPLRLEILPLSTPAPFEPAGGQGWSLSFEKLTDPSGGLQLGISQSWLMLVDRQPVMEIIATGQAAGQHGQAGKLATRRRLALLAIALLLAASFFLRQGLRRRGSDGRAIGLRILIVGLPLLLFRLLLLWGHLPGQRGGDAVWGPSRFGVDGAWGLLANPGEFLISSLAAFAFLLLLLRPYLGGREKESAEGEPGWTGARLALGPLAALTGLAAATGFARLVMFNTAPAQLFHARFLDPSALVHGVALFLSLACLFGLFLAASSLPWRQARPRIALPASFLSLILALLLLGPWPALALLLFLIVSWGFRRATGSFAGLILHLFLLVLTLSVTVHGATEMARRDVHDSSARIDRQFRESLDKIWSEEVAGELLLAMAHDESLRRGLANPESIDPMLALSLWRKSDLSSLDLPCALRIHDSKGFLRSRFAHGLSQPLGGRPALMSEMPDLHLRREWLAGPRSEADQQVLRAEIAIADEARARGTLVLFLGAETAGQRPGLFDPGVGGATEDGGLLAGSGILFLHLLIFLTLVTVDALSSRLGFVRRHMPPLLGPRAVGFQLKLLGSFLMAALLPAALIGLLAADLVRNQYDEASQRSSLQRTTAARLAMESRVRQDAADLGRSEYVRSFLVPGFMPTARDIGTLQRNQIMIFNADGDLLLDESLRNWSPGQVRDFLSRMPDGEVVYERSGPDLFAGLMLPMHIFQGRERVSFSVYYRMKLSAELLEDLALVVSADLNLYRNGSLIHSSQPLLFGLGHEPMLMDPAELDLLTHGAGTVSGLGIVAGTPFGRASLALPDAAGRMVGVLSSLDFSGLSSRRAALRRNESLVLGLGSALMLLVGALGVFLAGRIFHPIRRLQRGTQRIAAGDLAYRLPGGGRDELGQLVASFNAMTDRLEEAQQETIRRKRLEAWREMARQVAHEIKNPLTPLKLSAQHMERAWREKRDRFEDIFDDSLTTIYEQVEILRRIAREFSSFGAPPDLSLTEVDLRATIGDVLAPYAAGELEVIAEDGPPVPAMASEDALRKVLLNLVENAREAMGEKGKLEWSCASLPTGAELVLRDFGPGISPQAHERLFEPYFSTKTGGTGLGLAICARLVEEMGGRLELDNHPDGGARARLLLPGPTGGN